MRYRWLTNGLTAMLLAIGGSGVGRAQARPADGVTLEWRAEPPRAVALPDGTVGLRVAGYGTTARPGQPRLPFAAALIAVPPDGRAWLEVIQIDQFHQPLAAAVALAPSPSGPVRDAAGEIVGGGWSPADEARPGPASFVELAPVGVVRGVSLARVTFYPALPAPGGLIVTTYLRVRLHYGRPLSSVTASPPDPMIAALRPSLANPEAADWGAASPAAMPAGPQSPISPAVMIEVDSPGLTAITYEALSASGFSLAGLDPALLRLERSSAAVSMEWEGDGDAAFEPGERLLFYAAPRFNRYTARDVYRLSAAAAPVARMASRPAISGAAGEGALWAGVTVETNTLYTPHCFCGRLPAGRDGDRWTWDDLRRPGRSSASYPFTLSGVAATRPATLTVWLIGYTNPAAAPDHRVEISLNGSAPAVAEWDGQQAITATVPLTPGLLSSGVNTLTLNLPGLPGVNVEGAWLDAFRLDYARAAADAVDTIAFEGDAASRAYTVTLTSALGARAYEVTDADAPILLTAPQVDGDSLTISDPLAGGGRRYLVLEPGAIRAPAVVRLARSSPPAAGGDYLVIAHPDFIPALSPLLALRQAQGLSVAVADVLAIYDSAGDGRPTPDAIRAYLADVYATWSPRPTYVLLVGDGTFDPRRNRASSFITYVPPFLADVDVWMGETASDNRYAAVDGADALPDFLIGRLPVNSLAEAQTVVGKIVDYETAPPVGLWNTRAVFIADNPDSAGDFAAQAEALATAAITSSLTIGRVYYTATAVLTDTRAAVSGHWNAGASLVAYTGHSSLRQWGAERFFHMDDANGVANAGRLPVALELTCFTGSFHDAGQSTLDESLLRRAGGGAVGVWGATGMGVATGHDVMAEPFLHRIYMAGQPRVGEATLAGRLALAAAGQHLDLIDTFVWLGDPATSVHLNVVPGELVYLPIVNR